MIKDYLNSKTAGFIFLHIVALATAIMAVGPETIRNLFSHDPVKVTFAVCAAIVALGATLGAGISPQLMRHYGIFDPSPNAPPEPPEPNK